MNRNGEDQSESGGCASAQGKWIRQNRRGDWQVEAPLRQGTQGEERKNVIRQGFREVDSHACGEADRAQAGRKNGCRQGAGQAASACEKARGEDSSQEACGEQSTGSGEQGFAKAGSGEQDASEDGSGEEDASEEGSGEERSSEKGASEEGGRAKGQPGQGRREETGDRQGCDQADRTQNRCVEETCRETCAQGGSRQSRKSWLRGSQGGGETR